MVFAETWNWTVVPTHSSSTRQYVASTVASDESAGPSLGSTRCCHTATLSPRRLAYMRRYSARVAVACGSTTARNPVSLPFTNAADCCANTSFSVGSPGGDVGVRSGSTFPSAPVPSVAGRACVAAKPMLATRAATIAATRIPNARERCRSGGGGYAGGIRAGCGTCGSVCDPKGGHPPADRHAGPAAPGCAGATCVGVARHVGGGHAAVAGELAGDTVEVAGAA